MEGIFTLSYSEYSVANKLNSLLKRHGCSIYIPASRQQKGIDLMIHKNGTRSIARIQIKSSRSYIGKEKSKYSYYLWLNNFVEKYEKNVSDFYIIYGLFSVPNSKDKITTKNKIWKEIFLCYSDKEMSTLLKRIKTKTDNKTDSFYGYGFNSSKEIYLDRGFSSIKNKNASDYLLDRRVNEIIEFLND